MIRIDIPMPEHCSVCPALDISGDYPTCILVGKSTGYNFDIHNKRMEWCPLKEDKSDTNVMAFIEAGDMINSIFDFLKSDNYKDAIESVNGKTKEDGFRGALFLFPSIVLSKSKIVYANIKKEGE